MLLVSAFPMSGRCDVVEVNARLGRGIDMGNMFEAPSEEAWGNPWQSGYFKLIAELGFQHVRLPVRWEPVDWSLAEAPYTIRPDSLVFELLNEPQGERTAEKWNTLLAEGLSEIRKTNPTRGVLIGATEWGGLSALSKLVLPDDKNIILQTHHSVPSSNMAI